MHDIFRSIQNSLKTKIGFSTRIDHLDYIDEAVGFHEGQAIEACCQVLSDLGLILWYIKDSGIAADLHVIPQPL